MAGIGQQFVVAMTGRQFVQAAVPDCVGRPLRRQIAAAFVRRAHIAQDEGKKRFHQFATLVELQRGDDDALLVQLGRKGQRARRHAADIGVVGAAWRQRIGDR